MNDQKQDRIPLAQDVRGRVERMRLPASNGLLAVLEAFANALQSTHQNPEERTPAIEVRILRHNDPTLDGTPEWRTYGFEIVDNGAGFNDENLRSFCTTDSTLKIEEGGKGVGRLIWLRVFNDVTISSRFVENGQLFQRRFTFDYDGISPPSKTLVDSENACLQTTITLAKPATQYLESLQGGPGDVATYLLANATQLYLLSQRPQVRVLDAARNELTSLNDLLDDDLIADVTSEDVHVKGNIFHVQHLLRVGRSNSKHEIHLCAAGRRAQSVRLEEHVKELQAGGLPNESGYSKYTALISSPTLDKLASQDRSGLLWQEESGDLPTHSEIAEAIAQRSREFLGTRLRPLEEKQERRIEGFLLDNPYYRYLYKRFPDHFKHLSPEVSDNDLDVAFYEVEQKFGKTAREELGSFLEHVPDNDSPEDRGRKLNDLMLRINEVGQSKLARHVAYRQAVIAFLEANLEQADRRYSLEEVLHSTIWPKGTTSEDDAVAAHNLWLVDDRFAYFAFAASDKEMKSYPPPFGKASDLTPDIAIFDRAMTFVDDRDEVSGIILLELKRPGRDDYRSGVPSHDPVKQLLSYAKKLKEADSATDAHGAHLPIRRGIPLFGYIIADITPSLRALLEDLDFNETFDGGGWFKFHDGYGCLIEVVPYRKLVRDAKKRNQSFFQKLGLGWQRWIT